jgi:hypothetical protein
MAAWFSCEAVICFVPHGIHLLLRACKPIEVSVGLANLAAFEQPLCDVVSSMMALSRLAEGLNRCRL